KAWVDNWRDSSLKWTSSNSLALDKATGTIELCWNQYADSRKFENLLISTSKFCASIYRDISLHTSRLPEYPTNRSHIRLSMMGCVVAATMVSGSGSSDSEVQRTMLELLNLLDGFEASNNIKARIEAALEELDTGKSSKARDLGDLKNMINTSTEARGADELTDKKIAASHAWVKAVKAQEKEILMKVEMIQRMISELGEDEIERVDEPELMECLIDDLVVVYVLGIARIKTTLQQQQEFGGGTLSEGYQWKDRHGIGKTLCRVANSLRYKLLLIMVVIRHDGNIKFVCLGYGERYMYGVFKQSISKAGREGTKEDWLEVVWHIPSIAFQVVDSFKPDTKIESDLNEFSIYDDIGSWANVDDFQWSEAVENGVYWHGAVFSFKRK
ncbi:hypothetical protein Tco_0805447, partial [Tanacetum coccineum]